MSTDSLPDSPSDFLSDTLPGAQMPLTIYAVGSYVDTYAGEPDSLNNLKPVLKSLVADMPRRLTRFVQLALIGAARCCQKKGSEVDAQEQPLPQETGVYFSSCRGDTGITTELLNQLVRDKSSPAPLTFINSVSNAGCFFVAKTLGLFGRSNFVANRFDPIVSALSLAQLDLYSSTMPMALVGSVDSCSLPLSHHRARLFVPADQAVAEVSHWLLVGRLSEGETESNQADVSSNKINRKPLARIRAIHYFADLAELVVWVQAAEFTADCLLGIGQHLQENAAQEIQQQSSIATRFTYISGNAYYDSPTAEGIIDFVTNRNESMMLHVNSDPSGRYTAVLIER